MNKTAIVKRTISLVVASGTGKIVGDIIKNNTATPESAIDQITYTVGAYALGGMIAAKTAEYTDARVEEIIAVFRKKSVVPAEAFDVTTD